MPSAFRQDFMASIAISVSRRAGNTNIGATILQLSVWNTVLAATDGEYRRWLVKEPRKFWWPLAGQSFDAIILLNLMER